MEALSMHIGMRFHLYIFFTMFCVHSFSVFLFIMLIWSPTVVSQHLSKSDKRGWLTRWLPRSGSSAQFALPIFPGDDVIDWSWWWEKVAHQIWWWRHRYVMRYSLSKLTAYTCLKAFISACLYGVPQLTLALNIQANRTFFKKIVK